MPVTSGVEAKVPSPEGAKSCSRGREPTVSCLVAQQKPRRGDSALELSIRCRPFGAYDDSFCERFPRAHASGYTLRPLRGRIPSQTFRRQR
jgi:hypothetical protein